VQQRRVHTEAPASLSRHMLASFQFGTRAGGANRVEPTRAKTKPWGADHGATEGQLLDSLDYGHRGTELTSIVPSVQSNLVNLVEWSSLDLRELIGMGSFGEVRVAEYNATQCAIKTIRPATRTAALAELVQEFELTMQLHHPNVLLTMGIAHERVDGRTGILMELMPASLLEVLQHHKRRDELATWQAALFPIALDVAKGMAYLHAKAVLHRDLKPGNVLLTEHWVAKVADFGAALTKHVAAAEGLEGAVGTPPYMAPEVITSAAGAQAKPIDVWSFGCVLTHMGSRQVPFSHAALPAGAAPKDVVRALMDQVVEGKLTPLDQLRETSCPPEVLSLASGCVQVQPAARPTFAQIVKDLERMQAGVGPLRPSVQLLKADVLPTAAGGALGSALPDRTYCAGVCSTYVSGGSCLSGSELTKGLELQLDSVTKSPAPAAGQSSPLADAMMTMSANLLRTFNVQSPKLADEEEQGSQRGARRVAV